MAGVGGMESVGVAGSRDSPLHLASAARGFLALWRRGFKHCKISEVFEMLGEPGQLKIMRMSDPRLPSPGSAVGRMVAKQGSEGQAASPGQGLGDGNPALTGVPLRSH